MNGIALERRAMPRRQPLDSLPSNLHQMWAIQLPLQKRHRMCQLLFRHIEMNYHKWQLRAENWKTLQVQICPELC